MTFRVILIEDQPLQLQSTARMIREAIKPPKVPEILLLSSEYSFLNMIHSEPDALKMVDWIVLDVSLPILGPGEAMHKAGNVNESVKIIEDWWEKKCRPGVTASEQSLELKVSGSTQRYAGIRCALAAWQIGFLPERVLFYSALDVDETMAGFGIRSGKLSTKPNNKGVLQGARLFRKITHDKDLRDTISGEEGDPPGSAPR